MNHTPGPWTVQLATQDGPYITANDGYTTLAELYSQCEDDLGITSLANARLIAAAPDLLTALENLVRPLEKGWHVDDWDIRITEARAALVKAEKGD